MCDVQRFSIHDGPGIRTTIFFKGCPLACRWCQNPETISFANEPVHSASECILCGDCARACPASVIRHNGETIHFDRSRCQACLACTQNCPSGAMAPAARTYRPQTLLDEALRDMDYYGSDGGITLSGGEPLAQQGFLAEFLPRARDAGLHVVAETAGHWSYPGLESLLDLVDLFLFDVKAVGPRRHQRLTGRSNERILANLERLVHDGRRVEVRMPVVPGHNDDPDNLHRTARLLVDIGITTITLLPYHPLGQSKLAKMDAPIPALALSRPSDHHMAEIGRFFESRAIDASTARVRPSSCSNRTAT